MSTPVIDELTRRIVAMLRDGDRDGASSMLAEACRTAPQWVPLLAARVLSALPRGMREWEFWQSLLIPPEAPPPPPSPWSASPPTATEVDEARERFATSVAPWLFRTPEGEVRVVDVTTMLDGRVQVWHREKWTTHTTLGEGQWAAVWIPPTKPQASPWRPEPPRPEEWDDGSGGSWWWHEVGDVVDRMRLFADGTAQAHYADGVGKRRSLTEFHADHGRWAPMQGPPP